MSMKNFVVGDFKFNITFINKRYHVKGKDTPIYFSWLNKLNYYSISKNYNIDKIKKLLIHLCNNNKHTCIYTKTEHEILRTKERIRIMNILDHKKPFAFPYDIIHAIPKTFNRREVADIIVAEYMLLYNCFLDKSFSGTIDIVDNNIYHIRLKLNNFNDNILNQLNVLNMMTGDEKYVSIDIKCHPLYYPIYPPMVGVISPEFIDLLNIRIANTKYTKYEYWNMNRTLVNIVRRIINIINTYGEVFLPEIKHDTDTKLKVQITKFNDLLLNNAYIFTTDISDIIDTDMSNVIINNTSNTNGTGYGNNNSSLWNIELYNDLSARKKQKIIDIFTEYIDIINNIVNFNQTETLYYITNTIKNSYVYIFIIEQLQGISMLDIHNNQDYYVIIFKFIELFSNNTMNSIYFKNINNTNLYKLISVINDHAKKCISISNTNTIAVFINYFYNRLMTVVKIQQDFTSNELPSIVSIDDKSNNSQYITLMSKYKFIIGELHNLSSYRFTDNIVGEQDNNMTQCYKRMSNEIPTLIDSLQITENASILTLIDKYKPNCARYLMTGPPNTPYAYGIYIFDSYTDHMYPLTPPYLQFINTSGLRINPNLYGNGKVCLSLLGTYIGPKPHESEKWNPTLSSLYQILISIQSHIFVNNPYFNEPGFEKLQGTAEGDRKSQNYNEYIQYDATMCGIIDIIRWIDRYPNFKNAILTHFYFKKNKIINQYNEWINNCVSDAYKERLITNFEHLQKVLHSVSLPN